MSYKLLLAQTWRQRVLFSVLLELTYDCNHRCSFCYNVPEQDGGKLLDGEQYLGLLSHLQQQGTMNLTLSGGEPLLSPYFFLVGKAAREMGFVVRIKSNGYLLDEHMAERIRKEIDPFVVELSLHGAKAATHERQTRVKGSFKRIMTNIKSAQSAGLRLQINTPLTSWNEEELEEVFNLADELDVSLVVDDRVTPRDNGDRAPLELLCSEEAMTRLFVLREKRRVMRNTAGVDSAWCGGEMPDVPEELTVDAHCGAGLAGLTVDPFGNVYPCIQWRRRPVGNLHERTITEIWTNNPALEDIRHITSVLKRHLEVVDPEAVAGGFCPALAEEMTGSAVTVDERTRQRSKTVNSTRKW